MALFKVSLKSSVEKDLRKIDRWQALRILKAIEGLATDPFPSASKKLVGSEYTYRVRVGDYRIVDTMSRASREIEVQRVAHRKEVYR